MKNILKKTLKVGKILSIVLIPAFIWAAPLYFVYLVIKTGKIGK